MPESSKRKLWTSGLLHVEATDTNALSDYSNARFSGKFRCSRAIGDDGAVTGVGRRDEDAQATVRANRRWWDDDADDYHAEHGAFLGDADFVWCPERLREQDARLLGDVAGRDVLEVGCGAAMCSRWLVGQGAAVIASDLSAGMLRQ